MIEKIDSSRCTLEEIEKVLLENNFWKKYPEAVVGRLSCHYFYENDILVRRFT